MYRQVAGGPIGLRASGPIGRILMDYWAKQIRKMAEVTQELYRINPVGFEEIDISLLLKYVDDCFVALKKMRPGIRWDEMQKCMLWSQEDQEKDKEAGVTEEANTMIQFSKMAMIIQKQTQRRECPSWIHTSGWEQRQENLVYPKSGSGKKEKS